MDDASLTCAGGEAIPLLAARWNGRVLIECSDPAGFLREVGGNSASIPAGKYPPGTRLRGVVISGEGAYFDLFDEFGTCVREVMKLSASEAQARVLDLLVWEAKLA